ncbi:amidohydrolase family protein [Mesorhizobium sp. BR1-1-16]|uniref:amidohydrolase family protein n=1 Tax=Mesorhizobium sp. BR1-1-16 TaxID=2876653 RepID=UPI001CCECCF6|nr:amidohydrolase family protein [Mesorhizobium sp. BR1-1-16]MBZ9935730.1 amidohydrolase family protein [Mesorhizobium sp. BR1-1-16]
MTMMVITGGLVADLATGTATARDLLIDDGRITAIEPPGHIEAVDCLVHDATDRLILPGFVNSHTHGHANLVKGVADRWTLEVSLTNGPWMGGARDAETMYLSTLIGAVDMLSKGCTACFDLVYEFPRPTVAGFMAVARAYADSGIKAALAPMVADKTLFTAIPGLTESLPPDLRETVGRFALGNGEGTLEAVEAIIAERANLPPGISLALAPTIPHHCSEGFLLRHADLAERHGLPLHMHVAESRLQATVARDLWGQSPVAYLAERGVLGPHFIAAHAVWLDGADLDLLASHGCRVAHIPASNFRLGAGVAHVRPMLERGIGVGLATDGANSSDALSMTQAIRLASYASRMFHAPRESWLGAAETLRLATEGGADLLGLPRSGRIEVGASADLAFFDLGHIDFLPLVDPLNQVVTAADSGAISDVMVDGRFALRDRQLTRVDLASLRTRATEAVARLGHSLAEARAIAGRLEPHVVAFARSQRNKPLPINRFLSVEGEIQS